MRPPRTTMQPLTSTVEAVPPPAPEQTAPVPLATEPPTAIGTVPPANVELVDAGDRSPS